LKLLLVGAGGHAKSVLRAIHESSGTVFAYVDANKADWFDGRHYETDDAALAQSGAQSIVIGLGGTSGDQLKKRLDILDRYLDADLSATPVIHSAATVSDTAELSPGVIVLAGAIVQPHVTLERGAIVNTGAIVEHDCWIGPGAHVAPGAVVLGGCRIGACVMIGAGAVVLPNSTVSDGSIVKSLMRSAGDDQ